MNIIIKILNKNLLSSIFNYPYKKQYYILEKDSMITYWKTGVECANYINHKENVNTISKSVFTSISRKCKLYGYSIKKIWLTEQEFEKYYERNGDINATNQTFK